MQIRKTPLKSPYVQNKTYKLSDCFGYQLEKSSGNWWSVWVYASCKGKNNYMREGFNIGRRESVLEAHKAAYDIYIEYMKGNV